MSKIVLIDADSILIATHLKKLKHPYLCIMFGQKLCDFLEYFFPLRQARDCKFSQKLSKIFTDNVHSEGFVFMDCYHSILIVLLIADAEMKDHDLVVSISYKTKRISCEDASQI